MGVRQEQKQQKSAARRKVIYGILSVILIAGIAFFGYFLYHRHQIKQLLAQEGIYQNVTIDGMDMSGKSKEEALQMLQQAHPSESNVLTFRYEEDTWDVPFLDIEAGYHLEQAVEQAYNTGRSGTEKENYRVGATLLKENIDIALDFSYNTEKLKEKLQAIAQEFDREAVDSTVSRKNGSFVVTPEKVGRVMNQEQTITEAAEVLDTHTSGTASIIAEETQPKITAEQNGHVKDLLGSFSTAYNNSDPNRNINLRVGCNYINGTVVAPGEVFSTNANLGSQTYAGGYKDAAIYNNGKVEKGIAGGVCQVSSTLYNAVLMAELEVVERQPHSMKVGYVPLGRDAAIAGTYKDFKFKNNTQYPVLVEAYASGGQLVMNIYGEETRSSGRSVSYETVFEATVPKLPEVVTEDPEMPEGERVITSRGQTGAKVSVYKVVYQNGVKQSSDWFSSSSYRSSADYVTVGTKKPEGASEGAKVEENAKPAGETPQAAQ